jgi:hypothetical protein
MKMTLSEVELVEKQAKGRPPCNKVKERKREKERERQRKREKERER